MRPDTGEAGRPALEQIVASGLDRAAAALSAFAGEPIGLASTAVETVPLCTLSAAAGSPEAPAIGVYVGLTGLGDGAMLLVLEESAAAHLAGRIIGEAPEAISFDDELTVSALAEAGNLACSSFVNALSEEVDLSLRPTPPVVLADMRGAILDVAIASIAAGDEGLLVRAQLTVDGSVPGPLDARLLVFPSAESLPSLTAPRSRAGAPSQP